LTSYTSLLISRRPQTCYEDVAAVTECVRATGAMLQLVIKGMWRGGEVGHLSLIPTLCGEDKMN